MRIPGIHHCVSSRSFNTVLSSADGAYQELRARLAAGRFAPGQRLFEVELSQQLGVSRTPIREALRRLQADGLVVPAGRGAAVATITPTQVESLYQFRSALEALTAELAAARNAAGEISRAQLRRLTEAREAVENAGASHDPRAVSDANLAMHRYIAELSGNEFAIESLSRVWDKIAISSLSNVTDPEWLSTVYRHHRQLVDAITSGETATAATVARGHVDRAAQIYREHVGG